MVDSLARAKDSKPTQHHKTLGRLLPGNMQAIAPQPTVIAILLCPNIKGQVRTLHVKVTIPKCLRNRCRGLVSIILKCPRRTLAELHLRLKVNSRSSSKTQQNQSNSTHKFRVRGPMRLNGTIKNQIKKFQISKVVLLRHQAPKELKKIYTTL